MLIVIYFLYCEVNSLFAVCTTIAFVQFGLFVWALVCVFNFNIVFSKTMFIYILYIYIYLYVILYLLLSKPKLLFP